MNTTALISAQARKGMNAAAEAMQFRQLVKTTVAIGKAAKASGDPRVADETSAVIRDRLTQVRDGYTAQVRAREYDQQADAGGTPAQNSDALRELAGDARAQALLYRTDGSPQAVAVLEIWNSDSHLLVPGSVASEGDAGEHSSACGYARVDNGPCREAHNCECPGRGSGYTCSA
ncbi:hypothetical protein DZF92_09080 [Clavibacter michiganensis subsp. insidiosus]|uniref:Uncharacterized protein n=1 Tax=Clavibacter michiganensis subsp. insidiosus TaxID=33014 RepID=A0A399MYA3_9MICO|nr:hypothetical protein DZF92_09080 [Clavibacter michiganensis subsp. insidiosus]RIJ45045.1 hypothetical protein DZF93_00445 [Clavibacter michiganensis subsp. insidiosus]